MFGLVSKKKYDEVVYKLECLLCHATDGKFSKAGYSLDTMERAVSDAVTEQLDRYEEDLSYDIAEEIFWEIDKLLTFIVREDGEEHIAIDLEKNRELKKRYARGVTG